MLVALALFLTAGVILFTVFTSPDSVEGEAVSVESTSITEVVTTTSQTTENITTPSTDMTVTVDDELININTASLEELMTLNGIGEVKAQAIIDYRETYGLFPNINSLMNVSGIGDKTFAKIADKITV